MPHLLQGVFKIVCVGDSITQAGDPSGYVAMIRNKLHALYPDQNIEVINAGISGQKAPDMLARWQKDVLEADADLVTLSVGVNDVWHGFYNGHPTGDGPAGVPLPTYIADVDQMVSSATDHHIKVVVVSPTVITEDATKAENRKLQGYVDAERDIAKKHGAGFIDLHKTFLDRLGKLRSGPDDKSLHLTVDGVHMNHEGNMLMAFNILRNMGISERDLTDLEPGG